jgi:hypothetical protein
LLIRAIPATPAAPDSTVTGVIGMLDGAIVQPTPELRATFERVGKQGDDLHKAAERTFVATLGFYNSSLKRLHWTPAQLVERVKARFHAMGLIEAPAVPARTLGKMRLQGVPGLRVAD